MFEKIKKLFDVKLIITLSLTLVYCIMVLRGNIDTQFLTIYATIIAFYFGTEHQKNINNKL